MKKDEMWDMVCMREMINANTILPWNLANGCVENPFQEVASLQ
jgi:hypothetical protein